MAFRKRLNRRLRAISDAKVPTTSIYALSETMASRLAVGNLRAAGGTRNVLFIDSDVDLPN